MNKNLIPFNSDYEDYLHDESRKSGFADYICFPKDEKELIEIVSSSVCNGQVITIQGARTGITAGAVSDNGLIINLSKMNSIGEIGVSEEDGFSYLKVQSGVLLADLKKIADDNGLFFPPDPTETSASIGGMAACNASGAMTYHYGSTRCWIESIRVILVNGEVVVIKRNECLSKGRKFSLNTVNGNSFDGMLPSYKMPDVKSAAGYFASDDMDLIDLFIGAEGTLGIISEIELKLIEKPVIIAGFTIFFSDEKLAVNFVKIVRGDNVNSADEAQLESVAIEFFNHNALDLIRKTKIEKDAFSNIPSLKEHYHTAVYVEFHKDNEDELDEAVMKLTEIIAELGVSDDDTWAAFSEDELESQKAFRHAIPEAVNIAVDERKRINAKITKLGTDMSVPDEYLEWVMNLYNKDLKESGLDSVIFGHIGNNHVHVNILPQTLQDYEIGKKLYLSWAEKIVGVGGSVSAEHGIGKIKKEFLRLMYGDAAIEEMKNVKKIFDPEMILNQGNLFNMEN